MPSEDTAGLVATLVDNHRAFLRYLERVGNRALAEDILQEAFAKVIARPGQAPTDERLVPWFYATLFNAAIDQFRRLGAADRAHEAFAKELERARVAATASVARFIRPDEAITLEYSSARLNL